MIGFKGAHVPDVRARPEQLEAGPPLRRAAARDEAGSLLQDRDWLPRLPALGRGKHRPMAHFPGPAITTGASSPIRAKRTLRRWAFPHRPDFDGAHAGHCTSCGDGDRLVETRDVDEHVATELLARFC